MSRRSDFFAWLDAPRGRNSAPAAAAPAADAKALGVQLAPDGFVNEVYIPSRRSVATDSAALQNVMSVNELVYACVHIKSTSARDPRLIVQQQITREASRTSYEEIPGHPFRQLIMHPNPMMTESDLMQAAIVSWDTSNPRRFYAEKVYKNNMLAELWPLNPAWMVPIYRRTAPYDVIGYTWKAGRDKREYSVDELLIRTAPAWYDPPPMVAARGSIGADTAQTDTILTYFENGGIPPIFLKYTMALNDEMRAEIRAKWRSIYGGGQAVGDIGVLDSNSDVKEVGSKLDQLASQTLRSVSESRICMVFGVPPLVVYAYVGLMRATYSNLREAWRGFWDATMSPTFKEWRDFFTWSLLPEFEKETDIRRELVRLNYDMSQVSALQEDVDAIQNRARSNYQARLISQNEGRAAIGYGPVDGGDDSYYSNQPEPATAPQKSAQADQAPGRNHARTGSQAGRSGTIGAKVDQRAAMAQKAAVSAARARIERGIRRDVARYLREQYAIAAENAAA